jgi:acyl carrier protein
MNEKELKALEIIARISKKERATLTPDKKLVADLGIDSPKALEMMCDLEEQFKIELPEDAVARIETVGDILAIVQAAPQA